MRVEMTNSATGQTTCTFYTDSALPQ